MDLPTALVALIVVAVVAYVVTVVHVATTRALGKEPSSHRPEEWLLAWPKWLFGLIAVLLVIWLVHAVRAVLLPFVLGGVIAYLLNPAVVRLERRGWRRDRAVWAVFGAFLAIFVIGVLLIVPKLTTEARELISRYDIYAYQMRQMVIDIQEQAVGWGRLVGLLPEDVRRAFGNLGERAQQYAGSLLDESLRLLNRSLVLVLLLILTPVVTFWVLRDYRRLGERLLRTMPEPRRTAIVELLAELNKLVGSYLLGMATLVIAVGVFAIVVLSVAGVAFSALFGIMTGVLYVIPYVGFPTAMVVIGLTMAVTGQGLGAILTVLGLLMAGNVIFDYMVTPRVIGSRVGLHPLVVIFALLAGAALFRFAGIVLAVPVAGAIKVVVVRFWPELFGAEDQAGATPQTG